MSPLPIHSNFISGYAEQVEHLCETPIMNDG